MEMSTIAQRVAATPERRRQAVRPSYAHAHWYVLAALGAVVLGFWPSFFRPLDGGTPLRNVHGITSTLWYVALMLQSWLMSRGNVKWHRRVAVLVVALLPVLVVSALASTRIMLTSSPLPPPLRPFIAYLDFTLVALLVALFALGLLNRRVPPAHKRYMVSTVFIGFPPALARYYIRLIGPAALPFGGIHLAFFTVELLLVIAIVVDWRMGERRRWAYPISLATFVAIQALMIPLSSTDGWLAFSRWFAAPAIAT
jgi:hypothetical protein